MTIERRTNYLYGLIKTHKEMKPGECENVFKSVYSSARKDIEIISPDEIRVTFRGVTVGSVDILTGEAINKENLPFNGPKEKSLGPVRSWTWKPTPNSMPGMEASASKITYADFGFYVVAPTRIEYKQDVISPNTPLR